MRALAAEVAAVLLDGAGRQAAPSRDGDLVLSRDLGVQPGVASTAGEAPAELALLKVGDGVLAVGHVLGEEVVEVVRDERVPHAAGVAQAGQDGEADEELAEGALLLPGLWLDGVGGDARGTGARRGGGRGRRRGSITRCASNDGAVGGGRGPGDVRGRDGGLLDGRGGRWTHRSVRGGRRVGDGRLAQALLIVGIQAAGGEPLWAGVAGQWPGSWTGP